MAMVFEKQIIKEPITKEIQAYKIVRVDGILGIGQVPEEYKNNDGPIVLGHRNRRHKRGKPLLGASVIWREGGQRKRRGFEIKVGHVYPKKTWAEMCEKIETAGILLHGINNRRRIAMNECTDVF